MTVSISARIMVDGHDITARCIRVQGSSGRFRGSLTRAAPGSCVITADDHGEFFASESPAATSWIGTAATIELRAADTEGWALVFAGTVDALESQSTGFGRQLVNVQLVDEMAVLGAEEITLPANTPAETTGNRIKRVLRAAGYTDSQLGNIATGTIQCVAFSEERTETALQWCYLAAASEGGTFWPRAGRPQYQPRGDLATPVLEAGDTPGKAVMVLEPASSIDRSLKVSAVKWTSAAGGTGTVGDPSGGDRVLNLSTLTSDTDTADVAEWWRASFGRARFNVRAVRFAVHAQSSIVIAQRILALQPSDVVRLSFTPPDASITVTDLMVDGLNWKIAPSVGRGLVVDITARLLFPAITKEWKVGVSELGDSTVIAVTAAQPSGHPTTSNPAGRVRWATNNVVGATAFAAGITGQLVPRYATSSERMLHEAECASGQVSVLTPTHYPATLSVCSSNGWFDT